MTDEARTDAPTQRFAVAWVVALVAIGLVVGVGTYLINQSLRDQESVSAILDRASSQRGRATDIAVAARTLQLSDTPGQREQAITDLDDQLRQVQQGREELATLIQPGLPEAARALLGRTDQPYRQFIGAAAALLNTADRSTSETQTLLAEDLLAAELRYQNALDAAVDSIRSEAGRTLDVAGAVNRAVALGSLALLVVIALLVFLPATKRIKRRLVATERAAELERERHQARLEQLARADHLTGLANRTVFYERLDHAIQSAQRTGKLVGLMFLDLDNFKGINDRYGHDAGDELLIEAARRLQTVARKTDTIARLGGDEFVILLEGLDSAEGAANVAQKTLDVMRESYEVAGVQLQVTTSIGIALYPDDATDATALIRDADSAMYTAKRAGRNTFEFSTQEMRERNIRRLEKIASLRDAVEDGRLRLVYQPQYSLDSSRMVGVEAFVRWLRQDGSEVPAADFIEEIEETDIMSPLGTHVLREACEQGSAWLAEGVRLRLTVNLSRRQLANPELPDRVREVLDTTGFDPSLLLLEVTESTLSHDLEAATNQLVALTRLGVGITLDDFGTGMSSLQYLRRLPLAALKIHGSFVREITGASTDESVVAAAVTGIARHLNLRAVAEGVERQEQVDYLRRIGCDEAQGYLLSRPLEPATVTRQYLGEPIDLDNLSERRAAVR